MRNFEPFTFILSAERAGAGASRNDSATDALRAMLSVGEIPTREVRGRFAGADERAFVVVGNHYTADVLQLARNFEQDSILKLHPARDAELVYLDGRDSDFIGRFTAVTKAEAIAAGDYTADDKTGEYWICK